MQFSAIAVSSGDAAIDMMLEKPDDLVAARIFSRTDCIQPLCRRDKRLKSLGN
jgi:hypothetical protein